MPIPATSFYPTLMCSDLSAAASFWRDVVEFETTFENEWYISLRRGAFELGLVDATHDSIPLPYRSAASGVLVNLEVEDAQQAHHELLARGANIVLDLRDEPWGQRHFIVAAPENVLLDVIQPIEPSPEFASAYIPTT